jgi:hypothetical protein
MRAMKILNKKTSGKWKRTMKENKETVISKASMVTLRKVRTGVFTIEIVTGPTPALNVSPEEASYQKPKSNDNELNHPMAANGNTFPC